MPADPRTGPRRRRGGTTTGDLSRIGARDREAPAWRGGRGAPYLVPLALALLAAAGLWVARGRLASLGTALASPETQIREALARQTRAQLDDVYGFHGGGTVELTALRFDDVTSVVQGARATVTGMLSAQGRAVWREDAAALAYLGRERFHMHACSIARWCGEGDQFGRLRGVLLALFRHRDALASGDAEAALRLAAPGYADAGEDLAALRARLARELPGRDRPVRVGAWQIRVERDHAEVGEDLRVGAAGRPERHVYRLVQGEGGRWLFASGL